MPGRFPGAFQETGAAGAGRARDGIPGTHRPASRCPVAVIRDPGGIEHGEIAVGVRNADDAGAALEFAFEEAALRKAHLLVVHACDENNPTAGHLAESLSSWRRLFPQAVVSCKQIDGHPGRILTAYTGFVDLTVVGRHDGPNGSIGHCSVLQALLNHAQAPIVIVPCTER